MEQHIIGMSKEEYFSYFSSHQPTSVQQKPQSQSAYIQRPKTSHYCLSKTKKLLPHIIEEYQYRITNQLLSEKIHHPKRDKLIAESFSQHRERRDTNSRKKGGRRGKGESKENRKGEEKSMRRQNTAACESGGHRRGGKTAQVEHVYKTFDDLGSSCYNYKNDYLISLENTRMGRRLINARSRVQDILTKTYYTYQIYNGKIVNKDRFLKINRNSVKFRSCNKGFGKINNGIKCFFAGTAPQENDDSPRTNSQDSKSNIRMENSFDRVRETKFGGSPNKTNSHGYQTNNPLILQTYGHGNLNFVITSLEIDSNPPIKPDCCLLLQVIEKDQRLAKVLTNYYAERNNFVSHICPTEQADDSRSRDCHTTAAFPYQYISGGKGGFGLKFRLHSHSHIYIRIIKVEGLQQRQLGVVKLDLQPFKTRVGNEQPFEIVKQVKEMFGVEHERQVFESQFKGHLYRFKKGEISATLTFHYQLYYKAFRPVKQVQHDDKQTSAERSNCL